MAHDAVAMATADDREALAVRVARRLSDLGSPGAEANGIGQLRAILGRVAGPETNQKEPTGSADARFVPLKPLGDYGEPTLFPKMAMSASDLAIAMRATWKGFTDDHGALPAASLEGYLDSLAAALQKHAWCVPAIPVGTRTGARDDRERGSNDVSVSDHARVTAAIAVALRTEDAAGTIDLAALAEGGGLDPTPCLALIGGDVSGVQRYLYTITSRRALRGLRGRSFYLQLLGEAVVQHLRDALGLPATSVLLEGGGHFYVLAPLSAVVDGMLATAVGEVSKVLLRHHGADLSVAVAHVELSPNDFAAGHHLTAAWKRLGQRLSVAKARRGASLDTHTLVANLFTPRKSEGLTHHFCATCQSLITDAPETAPDPDDAFDPYVNCVRCHGMEDLGDRLRLGTTLLTWPTDPGDSGAGGRSQAWRQVLRDFAMDAVVVGDRPSGDRVTVPANVRVTATRITDANLAAATARARASGAAPHAVGFRLVAQATPMKIDRDARDGNRVAELSDLADAGTGVKHLGFLRADVDNLGQIIQAGLRRGTATSDDGGTLARRIALSQALRLFFEGHLGTICAARNPVARATLKGQTDAKGTDRLYLIYSGGDDLFLAGAWDAVAETAAEITDALDKYVGKNPAIHLSAGLTTAHDKYPVSQASLDAGEALDDAKAVPDKNAVAIFGQAVPWQTLTRARTLGEALIKGVNARGSEAGGDGGNAPRQLVRLALRLCALEAEARKKHEDRQAARAAKGNDLAPVPLGRRQRDPQVAWGPWMWLGQYALGRMANDRRAPQGVIETIKKAMTTPQGMAELRIGATWADLAIRTRESRGQGGR
jgi:CRISPR-associated protein Csm1